MNRVRLIVRSCRCRCLGRGIDNCPGGSRLARVDGGCQWRATLSHPLDEPDRLQSLAPTDGPERFAPRQERA